MRMWMLPPKLLCQKHLLGEHGELHKFIPTFRKGYSVDKRFAPVVQIQFKGYRRRHNELADEMIRRGMNHKSPLPELPDFRMHYSQYYDKKVDVVFNLRDLVTRCSDCRDRLSKYYHLELNYG